MKRFGFCSATAISLIWGTFVAYHGRNRKSETRRRLEGLTLERTVDERYRLANIVLLRHPFFYQLASVQHGAVIAPAKGLADFIQRRLGQLARQIHGHLTRKGHA